MAGKDRREDSSAEWRRDDETGGWFKSTFIQRGRRCGVAILSRLRIKAESGPNVGRVTQKRKVTISTSHRVVEDSNSMQSLDWNA